MAFLVAEIGVNWDGSFDLAEKMMKASKDAGCDAVKFQSFKESMVKDHPYYSRLIKSSISKRNVETINEIASSIGIEWFCTATYVEAVDFLDPFVKRFKIRWFDGQTILKNKTSDLLQKITSTKKEVIISSEISPPNLKNNNIKWLYVVPKYPCKLNELDFTQLHQFDGYSNHCPNMIAPLTAAILGSKIIEVHITEDKQKDYLDNNVSFDLEVLKHLVKQIRESEEIRK